MRSPLSPEPAAGADDATRPRYRPSRERRRGVGAGTLPAAPPARDGIPCRLLPRPGGPRGRPGTVAAIGDVVSRETHVADAVFEEPRLAAIYDALDGDRDDLAPYLAMAIEFGARSVLDLGCGTGSFACLLASRGIEVTAVDPAIASLDVARRKVHADAVRWLVGDAASLPPLAVDLATMTGNVAQVFLGDEEWAAMLTSVRRA